jgi:hypothetical protein
MNELPTPPDAAADAEATELLRAWVIDQALECTLRTGAFEDVATWGVLLADVVRQVAEACAEHDGRDRAETVRLIRAAFDAEMNAPADVAAEEKKA